MPKQIENRMQGGRAARRACGLGRGRSILGAVANRGAWELQAAIAEEIAPAIAARRAADELAGLCGHYTPEDGVADWPRSKEFGEASEGGEVQSKCGHGYYPAHVGHGGEGRGGGDMASENSPILAAALAAADERGAISAAHGAE